MIVMTLAVIVNERTYRRHELSPPSKVANLLTSIAVWMLTVVAVLSLTLDIIQGVIMTWH